MVHIQKSYSAHIDLPELHVHCKPGEEFRQLKSILHSELRRRAASRRALPCPSSFFFFFRHAFSELPRPIALKLCRMVAIWLYFIIPLQKFGRLSPQKKLRPKTCNVSVNFVPLQILIANISGKRQHIQNRKIGRRYKLGQVVLRLMNKVR